jgi:ABC-type antimicrobial peptide transport system permease subunit
VNKNFLKIALKSLLHNKKDAVYQFLITLLLAAIIAGSLFTGHSVRESLRSSVYKRLGNTDIEISTGSRYFSSPLAKTLADISGEKSAAILEADGYCQNFSTNASALDINIYGVDTDFFVFHGIDSLSVPKGEVFINRRLADIIGINEGEEIMIRFKDTDPLPENAPFAPSEDETAIRKIMRVGRILDADRMGDFYLGVSQMEQSNIFMNIIDMGGSSNNVSTLVFTGDPSNDNVMASPKANRMLLTDNHERGTAYFYGILAENLGISDIGLSIRISEKRGEPEIITDRIFLDKGIVDDIVGAIPTAMPIITYMVNSFSTDNDSTPYSFAAALPSGILGEEPQNNGVIVNPWLAEDLGLSVGDTVDLTWFATDSGKDMEETSGVFTVTGILDWDSNLLDPSFMPEFPGISGSVSCSSWDAGVPILLDRIRGKDEDYWNKYQGTPKAFLSFSEGEQLWANNFGSATAVRFPVGSDPKDIASTLKGAIRPDMAGFTVTDTRNANINAANSGVDFSSLFLGLSMFIIFSCVILLSMALGIWFDSKKRQLVTYHAIGYNRKHIRELLIDETAIIALAASLVGSFMGYLFNIFIVKALNSVWIGAVQTNTINPGFGFWPLFIGFISTLAVTVTVVLIRLKKFLTASEKGIKESISPRSASGNRGYLIVSLIAAAATVVASLLFSQNATTLSFVGGILIFVVFILSIRQYYLGTKELRSNYSGLFYSRHTSQIIAPTIFLAAGIFAVAITGANKKATNESMLLPSGGTGGYLLWAETAVPVTEDLNSDQGRFDMGFDYGELEDIHIAQIKKLSGDNASCLNINHVTSPAILGIPVSEFTNRGSFSFASEIKGWKGENPWTILEEDPGENTIYGIADQTVLEWSFKMKAGDTIKYAAENGQILNIVIGAGTNSSVFQGYLLIGEENLEKWFPSVDGSSVFLIDGDKGKAATYSQGFTDALYMYGPSVEPSIDKLASFFAVNNTYLDVFMILGVFGMILGTAGLGFILVSNFNRRRKEFALMNAFGYKKGEIRVLLLRDQIMMLVWGITTGIVSGITATMPSLRGTGSFPWTILFVLALSMFAIGLVTLLISVRNLQNRQLIEELRRE